MEELSEALRLEADAQRALQAGDPAASSGFLAAAARYRRSWELAPPRSFGRLVGMLKASILGGDADEAARYALEQLGDTADSPASSYALALARLATGDDAGAAEAAEGMREGGAAFARAADAIAALAARDADAYAAAIDAIVADFAARTDHITGVRIAHTALMLDRLAEPRGLPARAPLTLPES